MGIRRVATSIFLAGLLAGCASDPGYGLRYVDGSYYSPGFEGRGDYYLAPAYDNRRYYADPFFDDDFGWLFYGSRWAGGWYGSPFYNYGGYCSVRYRYCPRGWADPFPRYDFRLYFGDPWYYGHGYPYPPRRPPQYRRPPPGWPQASPRPPRNSDAPRSSDAPRPRRATREDGAPPPRRRHSTDPDDRN